MAGLGNVHKDRIQQLNEADIREDARYVLYWMQQSQRVAWNHAFAYALAQAKKLDCGLVVGFGLMADYPEANKRHYTFMLEGLAELKEACAKHQAAFVLRLGAPDSVAIELAQDAKLVVCDRGYQRHQRQWRRHVASEIACRLMQVESDAVVPVEVASDKREYAARTIRKQLMSQYEEYLEKPTMGKAPKDSRYYGLDSEDVTDTAALLKKLSFSNQVYAVSDRFRGGTSEAKKRWKKFYKNRLTEYDEQRNDPTDPAVSHMSMYLHFGQISPAYLIHEVRQSHSYANRDSYIEELLVRRELAINFVYYTDDYDSFSCLPDWAAESLAQHKDDERETIYTREELENSQTDDAVWNTAMQQMREEGYLHNHLRMYWGKRIIAWTNTPQYAYKTALYLNNKYFLDGRDCSSFSNIAWLFGLHDRAWQEREVYGKVRIMTPGGLERKFDTEEYVNR